ncbi:GTP cyclohydrolase II [Geminicoccaceae bacterium 1502E]|nr:GTP cyclohydrolase II [Geminicoccaceae bacterium 1502E]
MAQVAAAERVLRSGGVCRVVGREGAVLVAAVDATDGTRWRDWAAAQPAGLRLVLTGPRALAVGLAVPGAACAAITFAGPVTAACIEALAGRGPLPSGTGLACYHASEAERAAIELAKRAGLLPAILSLPDSAGEVEHTVGADAVLSQACRDARALEPVVEAMLPIAATDKARLVAFRAPGSSLEHVALLVGRPEDVEAPLCRLHSECLTGDLFGSLRCDCGEQLDGAIARMAQEGHGVLLYLRQEGRGIGLVNKLRAYRLQEQGLDTVDANTHLGFHPDERDFAIAAAMLERLGIARIRLLTNNPEKLDALAGHGVEIVERLPLSFAANRHNRAYLETKARRSGHLLRFLDGRPVLAGGAEV